MATGERPLIASGHTGTCYLVGSGPGDPELLTVKAYKLLQKASVVVYDDLGAKAVLDIAPATAERIYVGKRGGQAGSAKQKDIDALLVQLCKEGKDVVRLKGGCLSVFSRVASELDALKREGIPFQMVPGISSALYAPLEAGFPLTDVQLSNSFTVLTGHDLSIHNWQVLAALPTLVILMGGARLADIVQHLISHGKSVDVPVCIIRSTGTETSTTWRGTLSDIVAVTQGQQLSPCIIVIGQVSAGRQ